MASQGNMKSPPAAATNPAVEAAAANPFEMNSADETTHPIARQLATDNDTSKAPPLMPSVSNEEEEDKNEDALKRGTKRLWNEDDEKGDTSSDESSEEDDDNEDDADDGKKDDVVDDNEDGAEGDNQDDNAADGIPLIPTDPKMVGLSVEERQTRLQRLFKSKMMDIRGRTGRAENFIELGIDFGNAHNVDYTVLSKRAVRENVKRRRKNEAGEWMEVPRFDSSRLVGPIRFFINHHANSFMAWINTHHDIATNGHPTNAQIGDYYYIWLREVVYPMYGISPNDLPLPQPH